jgi:L-amino acid N-acyltransferase YncA
MAVESPTTTIEALGPEHWPGVARVFEEGIATRNATFETEIPTWEAWDSSHLPDHRFVALRDGEVVGWVAVSAVSSRCVYEGYVENSVYVAQSARGQGVGRSLLEALIASTESAGIWTIQAGMFPENEGSIRLHRALGFETVGTHRRLGKLDGVWRDVLMLERRSDTID